jgi:hypothetical protein
VKDDNKWEKEQHENKKIRKAIKHIANKNSKLLPQFISQIKIEDSASKKPMVEVVPEWKPYFE